MKDTYEQLIKKMTDVECPSALAGRIFNAIERARRRQARLKLALFGGIALCSFVAFVPAWNYFVNDFYQSGSYQYLSLIFTDGATLLSSWKVFSLSVVESFPYLSATGVLGAIFAALASFRFLADDFKTMFLKVQTI
jgi:hypothetical protein